jgi:cytoskeleton protein RodZ
MPPSGNSRTSTAAAPQQARTGTFGERLRREREMRGIKLEEIAESTKIGKRNLLALEEEHFDQLPGGIFNKGFVRAYAKFLGLDEEQAVNDFLAASANYDQPEALQPLAAIASQRAATRIPSDNELRRRERFWALAALLALVMAGILYWRWKESHNQRPNFTPREPVAQSAPANPAPIHAPSQSAVAQAPSQHPQQTPSATNSEPQGSTTPPKQPPAKEPDKKTSEPARAKPIADAPEILRPGFSDGISLIIHAKEDSWISVTADGQQVLDSTLNSGESRQLRADRELVLKTGNAGGLDVSFNGQPLPALGKQKQVKTLTFSAAGLAPSAAAPQR